MKLRPLILCISLFFLYLESLGSAALINDSVLKNIPPLPDPEIEKTIPHLGEAKKDGFARNFIWTFEDIRMLIGSNMPIFGDEDHPCVSLKLRDMKKPINVLTGMDYWLDNLMCQVNINRTQFKQNNTILGTIRL